METVENIRPMATVQKIKDIQPIPGADKIECLTVQGWKVVSRKGDFQIGDNCVYFEIDSIIPENILKSCNLWDNEKKVGKLGGSSGNRLKTVKMRGQISQGLVLPLSILPPSHCTDEGTDVTATLCVGKYITVDEADPVQDYEPKHRSKFDRFVQKWGRKFGFISEPVKYSWPEKISKTDETRIQNAPKILDELRGVKCYITTKMDGQSLTAYIKKVPKSFQKYRKFFGMEDSEWKLFICSRNVNLPEPSNKDCKSLYWKNAYKQNLLEKLKLMDGRYAIQGEQCGEKIQGNKMGDPELTLYVFNVIDLQTGHIIGLEEMKTICQKMCLQMVPIVDENFIIDDKVTVESLLTMADGQYANGATREGIVIRPVVPQYSQVLKGRASFKAISNKFLLEQKSE